MLYKHKEQYWRVEKPACERAFLLHVHKCSSFDTLL